MSALPITLFNFNCDRWLFDVIKEAINLQKDNAEHNLLEGTTEELAEGSTGQTNRKSDKLTAITNENDASEWALQGLPSDNLSLENATISTRSKSYPLLMDPQGQGKNWLIAKEAKKSRIDRTSMIWANR